jgi:hypothetical protein
MKSICVFCGFSSGARQQYVDTARELGSHLANEGYTVVCGGGKIGLMGAMTDAILENKGEVIGVVPESLKDETVVHPGLTKLHIAPDFCSRKNLMYELADAFITMPGGIGTLDELSEIFVHTQIGLCRKPSGILNIEGFFDPLLNMIDHFVKEKMLLPEHGELILVDTDPEKLVQRLKEYTPPFRKWWE